MNEQDIKRVVKPSTDAAQAMGWVEPAFNGVTPPIYMSSVYERDEYGNYPGKHSYSRDQNPSFDQTEALLARLEGAEGAMLFSSGMAAATSIFEVLAPNAHVIVPSRMYFAIKMWLKRLEAQERIRLTEADNGSLEDLEKALQNGADLLWIETPANPGGEIIDIKAWASAAKKAGAIVVADNTIATPILCQPISLGADLVMHSASKQLNGHGDLVAGALLCAKKDELWEKLQFERGYRGAVLGPMESWLLLRGMRTLHLRVKEAARNALEVASFLKDNTAVERVLYPGFTDHPDHDIAAKQMSGFALSLIHI